MEITNQEAHESIISFKQIKKVKGIIVPHAELNQVNKLLREKGFTIEIPSYIKYYRRHPRMMAVDEVTKIILLREDIKEEDLAGIQN